MITIAAITTADMIMLTFSGGRPLFGSFGGGSSVIAVFGKQRRKDESKKKKKRKKKRV